MKGESGRQRWQLTQRGDRCLHGPGLLLVQLQGADQSSEPGLCFGQQTADRLGLSQWVDGRGRTRLEQRATLSRMSDARRHQLGREKFDLPSLPMGT